MAGAYEGLAQALRTMFRMGETYASNIARSNVNGAQEVQVSVQEDFTEVAPGHGAGSTNLRISSTTRDLHQGPLEQTGSPTDLALSGPGNFLLFDQSGNLYLTRNGNFRFNGSGELINQQGLWVASFDASANTINKTTKLTVTGAGAADDEIAFNQDGFLVNLTRGNEPGRQLALAKVPTENGLVAAPGFPGVFQATDASGGIQVARAGQSGLGTIIPQALEQSNISMPDNLVELAVFKGNFSATAQALKALASAIDDIIAQFKPA